MLSVLMPAYNAGRYIGDAIDSVLAQTVRDLGLLVIDDGSKDDTLAVAEERAKRDPRVRVITQPNAGIAHTLNRGLEMLAGSEWVFLMHADDLMMPNRLERQVAFIEANPDVAVASSLVYYINGAGETVGHGRSPFTDPAAVRVAAISRGARPPGGRRRGPRRPPARSKRERCPGPAHRRRAPHRSAGGGWSWPGG